MKQSKIIQLTLLDHLFYYTEVSGGGTSAAVTGNFIGDLALNYALRKATRADAQYYRHLKRPRYAEIKDFGFYCTVARPVGNSEKTEAYIQNTLFNVDGYVDLKAIDKSGRSPFKNFRQVTGIRRGSRFRALLLSEDAFPLPPVIRMGRALETLVQVEEVTEAVSKDEDEFWLNAFSLKTVYDRLDRATELMLGADKVNFSYILENYSLIKQLSRADVEHVFEDHPAHG